jgi:hypothetical protein
MIFNYLNDIVSTVSKLEKVVWAEVMLHYSMFGHDG